MPHPQPPSACGAPGNGRAHRASSSGVSQVWRTPWRHPENTYQKRYPSTGNGDQKPTAVPGAGAGHLPSPSRPPPHRRRRSRSSITWCHLRASRQIASSGPGLGSEWNQTGRPPGFQSAVTAVLQASCTAGWAPCPERGRLPRCSSRRPPSAPRPIGCLCGGTVLLWATGRSRRCRSFVLLTCNIAPGCDRITRPSRRPTGRFFAL
jgi:hypothetical protein